MTTVDGIPSSPPVRTKPSSGAGSRTGFLLPPQAASANSRATEAANPSPITLDSVLALQQAGSDAEQDLLARRHGRALLTNLELLHRQLLTGANAAAVLTQLHGLVSNPAPAACDPALAAIIESIRLRVLVEVARRGG